MRVSGNLPELKERLAKTESRLAKINQKSGAEKYLEEVAKHFHLGMVGGSGNNNKRLDQKRDAAVDKAIDRAVASTELVKEIDYLKRQIDYIESGRKERADKVKQAAKEGVHLKDIKAGDTLMDSIYGEVVCVRVNKKTITIQTKSGYTEARPFDFLHRRSTP